MMKRAAVIVGVLSLCLVASVSSFSRASVVNKAKVHIARPQSALVAVFPIDRISIVDPSIEYPEGENQQQPGIVRIKNNTTKTITICSIKCTDPAFDDNFNVVISEPDLPSGQYEDAQIMILSSNFPDSTFDNPIEFQLIATWTRGSAKIDFDVNIEKAPAHKSAIIEVNPSSSPNITDEEPSISPVPTA